MSSHTPVPQRARPEPINENLTRAFIMGAERVAAWADLIDSINVFPVADGDTGRNLKISLAPLRNLATGVDRTTHQLLINARGNSGNIAARFFSGFLSATSIDVLPAAAREGSDRAWKAIHDPKPGTMLSVFDALVQALEQKKTINTSSAEIIGRLEEAVRATPKLLPALADAGVVDAGALGMFIFFEGFFSSLSGNAATSRPITSVFGDYLKISSTYTVKNEDGFCVDVALDAGTHKDEAMKILSGIGESVVVIPGDNLLKVHLHVDSTCDIRAQMERLGGIIRWSDDDLGEQTRAFKQHGRKQVIHVMTDAAGSVTHDDALRLGMTLLDSYVSVGDYAAPETYVNPADVYAAMESGAKASTSQASEFERHELYRSVTSQFSSVLYLCVGSAYTGNFNVASHWKNNNDARNRFTVIDTGAASGRLGVIALSVADYATRAKSAESVIDAARSIIPRCREYIFIDNLKFLAAGGRISKTKAFFGNMLGMRPIVSPAPEGVIRAGAAKTFEDQLAFALDKIHEDVAANSSPFIMLQYTNNRQLIESKVMPRIAHIVPSATIMLQPLSLTTGVHAGPGTWSIAYLSEPL